MTEPQSWTLIAGLLSFVAVGFGLVLRVVRVEIQAVIGVLGARIDGVDRRLDALDRDVQRLVDQHFRDQP